MFPIRAQKFYAKFGGQGSQSRDIPFVSYSPHKQDLCAQLTSTIFSLYLSIALNLCQKTILQECKYVLLLVWNNLLSSRKPRRSMLRAVSNDCQLRLRQRVSLQCSAPLHPSSPKQSTFSCSQNFPPRNKLSPQGEIVHSH